MAHTAEKMTTPEIEAQIEDCQKQLSLAEMPLLRKYGHDSGLRRHAETPHDGVAAWLEELEEVVPKCRALNDALAKREAVISSNLFKKDFEKLSSSLEDASSRLCLMQNVPSSENLLERARCTAEIYHILRQLCTKKKLIFTVFERKQRRRFWLSSFMEMVDALFTVG